MGWSYTTRTKNKTYSAPAGPVSGFFMVLVALALLGGAGWTGKNTYELVTAGTHVQGRVAEVKQELSTTTKYRDGYSEKTTKMRYKFIVDFKDGKGTTLQFKDSQSADYRAYNVGEEVPVLYLERDPRGTATIDHGFLNWILPGALGLFGVLLAVFGGMAMFGGGTGSPSHPLNFKKEKGLRFWSPDPQPLKDV